MAEFSDQFSDACASGKSAHAGAGVWSLQADWVLPITGPAIRDGVIVIDHDRIRLVGPVHSVQPSANHERLAPHLAIMPGLVNAHTHLELSGMRGKLPRNAPMPEWIMALLKHRSDRAGQLAAVGQGARECLSTGTTMVGDISFNNTACHELAKQPIRSVAFAEVLGLPPVDRAAMGRLSRQLEDLPRGPRLTYGISPHAPYSTSPALYRAAIALARQRGWPIMTHLAETPPEGELLRDGGGVLLDMLRRLGVIDVSFPKLGVGPVELARQLGLLEADCLLAHVNCVDDAELDLLAAGKASVVYCPLSSRFFGRSGHRFAEMLRRGINVAVGTDSLASNDSLDMLAELRAIWAATLGGGSPDLPPRRDPGILAAAQESRAKEGYETGSSFIAQNILAMGTINGARALGLAEEIGSVEPHKQADLAVVRIAHTDEPAAAILQGSGGVERTIVAGQTVFRKSR